ncbi:MAG: hypothetical protein Roseis2KO_52030 [Roseivirga sp.]
MSILTEKIPFEIHLTTGDLPQEREQQFSTYCQSVGAKALLIELSRGQYMQQPMLSTIVYANHLEAVLSEANTLSSGLEQHNFKAKRLKIEIPAFHAHKFADSPSAFDRYFEWHGKISYTDVELIESLCQKHKVHLSVNALKNAPGTRFITLREYGSKARFEERVQGLLKDFEIKRLSINKQQAEYCIYDNNSRLDAGWLPQ